SPQTRTLTSEPGILPVLHCSPDGKWVVFQSTAAGNSDLRIVPFSGGPSRPVVTTPYYDYHPFVSPLGKWLYFQENHKNIFRVPGPAQNWLQQPPQKITNFPESNLYLEDPQISRDGKQLLYSRGEITGDIWLMDFGK